MSATSMDLAKAESALGVKLIANGIGTQALHDTIVGYRANRRAGTAATLTKAMVNASGTKPYRQKGTGHARAGYVASPIRRGGGVVFGPQPRDYSKKLPRKVRRLALRKAVSEAAKNGKLFSAAAPKLDKPKTKDLATWLQKNKIEGTALIITNEVETNLLLSGRNIAGLEIVHVSELNAEQVLRPKNVLVIEDAMSALGERIK